MPSFDLTDRVAIVTGGSSGIGRAIALALAEAGAHVVIAARTPENVAKVVGEIQGLGRRSLGVATDVREADQVARMVQQTVNAFGRIDILVNNAGASYGDTFKRGPLLQITEHDLDETFRLNVKSVFHCSRAVAPIMMEQGKGAIINNASMDGRGPDREFSAYGAAKAAVISLTEYMAMEWAPQVRVNAVCPGRVDTERARRNRDPEAMAWRLSHIAMGRMSQPAELAGAVVYLASDAASWTTGTVIDLHGGRVHF